MYELRLECLKQESIAKFILCLKREAFHCDCAEFLDRVVIEWFIHRLQSSEMSDGMISRRSVSFKAAREIAQTHIVTKQVKVVE